MYVIDMWSFSACACADKRRTGHGGHIGREHMHRLLCLVLKPYSIFRAAVVEQGNTLRRKQASRVRILGWIEGKRYCIIYI